MATAEEPVGHRRVGSGRKAKSSPTYNSWRAMILRCHNPERRDFAYYGQRGVQVCPQWLPAKYGGHGSFDRFLKDMGPRPEGTTLDRINVDGHYEPSNCRWATGIVQAANRRITDEDWEYDPDEEDGYRVQPAWPELVVDWVPETARVGYGLIDQDGDEMPF